MITAIRMIGAAIAIVFIAVGVVTLVMSHANEDGPLQSRGIMEIVTGLVIIILLAGSILSSNFGLATWIINPNSGT